MSAPERLREACLPRPRVRSGVCVSGRGRRRAGNAPAAAMLVTSAAWPAITSKARGSFRLYRFLQGEDGPSLTAFDRYRLNSGGNTPDARNGLVGRSLCRSLGVGPQGVLTWLRSRLGNGAKKSSSAGDLFKVQFNRRSPAKDGQLHQKPRLLSIHAGNAAGIAGERSVHHVHRIAL